MCLHISCITKIMAQFCYLKLYLGRETVSCRPLQRMARISNGLKHGQKVRPTFFKLLYYYVRNFCNLIGLQQWYFILI